MGHCAAACSVPTGDWFVDMGRDTVNVSIPCDPPVRSTRTDAREFRGTGHSSSIAVAVGLAPIGGHRAEIARVRGGVAVRVRPVIAPRARITSVSHTVVVLVCGVVRTFARITRRTHTVGVGVHLLRIRYRRAQVACVRYPVQVRIRSVVRSRACVAPVSYCVSVRVDPIIEAGALITRIRREVAIGVAPIVAAYASVTPVRRRIVVGVEPIVGAGAPIARIPDPIQIDVGTGVTRTEIDVCTTLVDLAVRIGICADDQICRAIAVDISRGANRSAEAGEIMVGLRGPCRLLEQPGRRAEVQRHPPFVRVHAAPLGRTDDRITRTVSVHITHCCEGPSSIGEQLFLLKGRECRRIEPGERAAKDPDCLSRPLRHRSVRASDQQVVNTIAVHVAAPRHRDTESERIRIQNPSRRIFESVRGSSVYPDCRHVTLLAPAGGPDHDVVVPVGIYVTCPGDRDAVQRVRDPGGAEPRGLHQAVR
jgi:hypothetical protein